MKIRIAHPEDIPQMMALERVAATAAHWAESGYARIFQPMQPTQTTQFSKASDTGSLAWVAEDDEAAKIGGFVVAHALGEEWEIENVVVAESGQRRGLGSRLVRELLEHARSRGVRKVFLEVRESNLAAHALYAKLGFVSVGRRKSYYSHPTEDAWLLSFTLPANGGAER